MPQCTIAAGRRSSGGLDFCLDGNLKSQQAQDAIVYRMEREHDRLLGEIDMISGIPSTGGR